MRGQPSPRVRRLTNIRASPERVTVLIDHYEDDWPAVWWVRLRGTGRVLEEGQEYRQCGDQGGIRSKGHGPSMGAA